MAMSSWDRQTAAHIIQKLDLNLIKLVEAKTYLKKTCRIDVPGRTKAEYIRELKKAMTAE